MMKLFGTTIDLPEPAAAEDSGRNDGEDCLNRDPCCSMNVTLEDYWNSNANTDSPKSLSGHKHDHPAEEEETDHLTLQESKDSDTTATVEDSSASSASGSLKPEEDQSEEKVLKKPDKILPCPRCNSKDTKFCYFNNYNVNQPRHFCKNCQRYWTAGGTVRNVPVGAGRRKNKNSISQFRHLAVQEPLQTTQVELPNGIHHPGMNDSPLCESMPSVSNIADETIRSCSRNGSKEDAVNHASRSSTGATAFKDKSGKSSLPELMPNCHPFPPQVHYFVGSTWPYPFMSTPPPYWGCALPAIWNVPVPIPPPRSTDQQMHAPPSSCPNSPTLRKRSRDLKLPGTEEERVLKETDSNESGLQKH